MSNRRSRGKPPSQIISQASGSSLYSVLSPKEDMVAPSHVLHQSFPPILGLVTAITKILYFIAVFLIRLCIALSLQLRLFVVIFSDACTVPGTRQHPVMSLNGLMKPFFEILIDLHLTSTFLKTELPTLRIFPFP